MTTALIIILLWLWLSFEVGLVFGRIAKGN